VNVCMILPGKDFPPDIRVEKEARALRDAGHHVFVLCDQIRRRAAIEKWEGITIIRRKRLSVPTIAEKLNALPGWTAFLDGQWRTFIDGVVRSESIDVLHMHDLPKAGAAIATGDAYALPVILDLHENYPASLKAYVEGWTGGIRLAVSTLIDTAKWDRYEKKQSSKADRIIVVVDEARNRLVQRGIEADKITVIENTEDTEHFSRLALEPAIIGKYRGNFAMLYIGGFGGRGDHRGLTTVIQAMPLVLKAIPNARLLLVGKGSIKHTLQKMISEHSLRESVELIDWVPFAKVPSYIAASAVCLAPHNSNPHTEATSPHKLFQYMLMGKPVVVSSCRPLKRIVEEIGGGIVFQAGDSVALSRAIIQLKDGKLREKLGKKGRRAVLDKYNWSHTSAKLINLYSCLPPKLA
jgi:glycosyltransferase involved in cell wall biosynthesis